MNKLTKRKITREDLTLRRVTKRTKITVTATNNEPDCLEVTVEKIGLIVNDVEH